MSWFVIFYLARFFSYLARCANNLCGKRIDRVIKETHAASKGNLIRKT